MCWMCLNNKYLLCFLLRTVNIVVIYSFISAGGAEITQINDCRWSKIKAFRSIALETFTYEVLIKMMINKTTHYQVYESGL